MKLFSLKREWIVWLILLIPIIFLLWQWNSVPETIPLHYSLSGEADRWGNKIVLAWLIPSVNVLVYLLLLVVPAIDPKKRIEAMGRKYFAIRLLFSLMISLLFLVFIYTLVRTQTKFTALMFPILAVFLIVLGNYLQTVKPNFFIGIRTPWTLHNDQNWLKTHLLASKVFVVGGMLLLIASILWNGQSTTVFYFTFIIIMIVIPVIYSYKLFRTKKDNPER